MHLTSYLAVPALQKSVAFVWFSEGIKELLSFANWLGLVNVIYSGLFDI